MARGTGDGHRRSSPGRVDRGGGQTDKKLSTSKIKKGFRNVSRKMSLSRKGSGHGSKKHSKWVPHKKVQDDEGWIREKSGLFVCFVVPSFLCVCMNMFFRVDKCMYVLTCTFTISLIFCNTGEEYGFT